MTVWSMRLTTQKANNLNSRRYCRGDSECFLAIGDLALAYRSQSATGIKWLYQLDAMHLQDACGSPTKYRTWCAISL